MKKFAFTVLAAATTFAATIPVANAQSTTSNFAVSATLTPLCIIGAFSTGGVAFGTVNAFAAANATASATATIRCTRGTTAPTLVFDSGATSGGGTGSTGAVGVTTTGAGVLPNGLYYTLSAAYAAPTAASTGVAPTTAGVNAQDSTDRVVTVSGILPSGQAGANTGATTHTRVMTVTY